MSRSEPPEVVRARVVAWLCAALPDFEQDLAQEALIVVNAHRHIGLRRLDAHLRAHPDALTSGSAEIPIALLRLLRYLAAAGHPVSVPACARCGTVRPLPERRAEGRICDPCAAGGRRRQCCRCDRHGTVAALSPEGPVCNSCHAADPSRFESCVVCGRLARVARRMPDGSPECSACYRRPAEPCSDCGRTASVTLRLSEGPLCGRCYEVRRTPRACGGCGRTAIIRVKARDGTPDLCSSCAKRPLATCVGCGRLRQCTGVRTGAPRCSTCRAAPVELCARCGEARRVRARWPLGTVCPSCYHYVRSHPSACAICGQVRPLVGPGPGGRGACGICAGARNAFLCLTCGSGRETERGPRCARCDLKSRLVTEFAAAEGQVSSELQPLIQALLRVPRARSILVWLDKPRSGAAELRALARSGTPITHESLDAAEPSQGLLQLRATLVHLGVLAPRDEPFASVQPWLDRFLTGLPPARRRIVRAYAQWAVLRRARRQAAAGRFTAGSAARVRRDIRVAAAFLAWLDAHHLTLAGVAQDEVDRWLAEHRQVQHLQNFLRWTQQRRLSRALTVPYRPRNDPHSWWSEAEHWEHLQRCVQDEDLPLDVRTAGALMLLYGLPVTRITKLTIRDLIDKPEPALIIGDHPVALPPSVFRLLRRQADETRSESAVGRVTPSVPWLFPGYAAGTSRSAPTLARKLRDHGLAIHPSRNTALLFLATELPASVLSKTLGISLTSALQWARRSARDWSSYLAARDAGRGPAAEQR